MDCLSIHPFDRQKKKLIITSDMIQCIQELKMYKAYETHLGYLGFDGLMGHSILDFVQATVIQEQILPQMTDVRSNMMNYRESQNLLWVTNEHVKTWGMYNNDNGVYELTVSGLQHLHRMLMYKLTDMNDHDKGNFCIRGRYSMYKGKRHDYPSVRHNQAYVAILQPILNTFNQEMRSIHSEQEQDLTESLKKSVYLASWIFYQLTCLHPFADGNGRTARVLASRCFPQLCRLPAFIWSKITPLEIEFVDALIEARNTKDLTKLDTLVFESIKRALENVKWRLNKMIDMKKVKKVVTEEGWSEHDKPYCGPPQGCPSDCDDECCNPPECSPSQSTTQ